MDAAEAAAERADTAKQRVKEIADRITRLAGGHRPDRADLLSAQKRAGEAQERAERSLERAVAGHERAALSHERTADVHDEAQRRGLGDPSEHARLAAQHRRDAVADRQEAAADQERRDAAGSEASGAQGKA
jgi:hypothetical protein